MTQVLKAHVSINVRNVEKSIDFYRKMLGIEPSKVRTGYAKFDVQNPPLNLALNEMHTLKDAGALSHMGLQVGSTDDVLSCASCTTNAIVPPLKAIEDEFGIEQGHVETVHSFTNDQNLLDNFHKGDRRGRSAPLNMVLTETGAASAIKKAMPDFAAHISGSSIRVPTPDVSMAILNLRLKRETTREGAVPLASYTLYSSHGMEPAAPRLYTYWPLTTSATVARRRLP